MLAVEHEIDVMFMDKGGHPIGRVWSPSYGSISTIRKGQLNFTASHAALEWIKEVIMQKMENQQALMLLLQPRDTALERERKRNIERIEDYRVKVSKLDGEMVSYEVGKARPHAFTLVPLSSICQRNTSLNNAASIRQWM